MSEEKKPIGFNCNHCHDDYDDVQESYQSVDGTICSVCYDEYTECRGCNDILYWEHASCIQEDHYCEDCFSDYGFWCEACGDAAYFEYSNRVGDEYYCEYCYENHDGPELVRDNKPLSIGVNTNPDENCKDRLVGIEAECLYKYIDNLRSPENWNLTSDGSINRIEDHEAVEWVSMPSNGINLEKTIDNLIDWSREYGGVVNKSCGLHVHIDATDTTWQDLVSIAIVGSYVEKYVYMMMPPSREDSNWCRPIPMSLDNLRAIDSENQFISEWYEKAGSSPSTDKYNDARYIGLNIHARYYLGSIEFRYHSGTLNRTKITNWIKICQSIVETGIKLSRDAKWEHRDFFLEGSTDRTRLSVMRRMIGIDREIFDYVVERTILFSDNHEMPYWVEYRNTVKEYFNN